MNKIYPEDLVAGIFALAGRDIKWSEYNKLEEKILSLYEKYPIIKEAGIIPDHIHKDSQALREGFMHYYTSGEILFSGGDIMPNPNGFIRNTFEQSSKSLSDHQIREIQKLSKEIWC